jgi:hypothetical protein
MFENMYKNGSEPIVIARIIAKAVNSAKPKTRYVAGAGGKLFLFARKVLSDKIYDKIVLSQMK